MAGDTAIVIILQRKSKRGGHRLSKVLYSRLVVLALKGDNCRRPIPADAGGWVASKSGRGRNMAVPVAHSPQAWTSHIRDLMKWLEALISNRGK